MPKFLDNIEFWTQGYKSENIEVGPESIQITINKGTENEKEIPLEIPGTTIILPQENPEQKMITDISRNIIKEKEIGIYQIAKLTESGMNTIINKIDEGLEDLDVNGIINQITALQQKDTEHDSEITALQQKDTEHDSEITALKQFDNSHNNIENGTGENSLIQKSFENVKNKAYQRNSVALGSSSEAGMTEEEFNEHFAYDRDGNIKNPITDDSGSVYSDSNSYAFAAGEEVKAKDRGSVAFGIANWAWGVGASAMGDHTQALSNFSHSFGQETVAGKSKYDGECATAFGKQTQAKGENSFAGGYGSQATNKHSFAFGVSAISEGFAGVAFGENTRASGADSLVAGRYSTASGNQSIALGNNAQATNTFSVAIGDNVKSTGWGQVAIGSYNNPDAINALFMVGNGNSESNKKNALTVLWDGRVKVQKAPADDDDVVRKFELDGGISVLTQELNKRTSVLTQEQANLLF